ncbi:MAG: hypothetical protein HON68_06410 [Gammaproteobacteria bacterium]|jgi:hypothetical protein|nr:hypothetical protein [Gammaproteobacteria bacterium]MBT3490425.1 hypothetical protein [Gammaproteobacteria bacterium]MBT3718109.1 hypothetical protein [Gammaproteobacteria bacterium]MBT3845577.1 hypothetical protein [Gammaproteobacteria bacterium]MBT3893315.1 hypothetical protein [Gammaproteobacteria bacterium]
MDSILQKLKGGDRRSIGQSEEMVDEVLKQPGLSSVLVLNNELSLGCVTSAVNHIIDRMIDSSGSGGPWFWSLYFE